MRFGRPDGSPTSRTARSHRTRRPSEARRTAVRSSCLHTPQSEVLLTEGLHQVAPEHFHQTLDLALVCGDRLELALAEVVGKHEMEREILDRRLRGTAREEDVEPLQLR